MEGVRTDWRHTILVSSIWIQSKWVGSGEGEVNCMIFIPMFFLVVIPWLEPVPPFHVSWEFELSSREMSSSQFPASFFLPWGIHYLFMIAFQLLHSERNVLSPLLQAEEESRNRYTRSCPSALHESEENITISSSLSFLHILHCLYSS